ncbi:MAG: F0F1 ATP synthase subunit A [Actinomycetia bacterium]|nr:F0F1 ATP synthase subunit A [Actinomycetes bacterium]
MGVTIPFVPLEGHQPPTFGLGTFKSRPIMPSSAWLAGDEAHYTWTDIWLTNHIVQAAVAAALVIGFWLWMARRQHVVPGKRQFVGEYLYDVLRNTIARDALGADYRKYLPYLVALFSFILVNNLFGQTFLFMFPTFSKVGFPYALALLSWLVYNGAGIAKHGFVGYFKHILVPAGVPWPLLVLIIPLEFLSNVITRPLTLTLRLFANLFAGHLVIAVFVVGGSYLLVYSEPLINNVAGVVALLFSLAVFALEILVGVLQSYIFTVLSAQYVASAIAEEH